MAYFLLMTCPYWLLTIGLAVLIIWLICRYWLREKQSMHDRIAELESQLNDIPTLKALIAELETAGTGRPAEPVPGAGAAAGVPG